MYAEMKESSSNNIKPVTRGKSSFSEHHVVRVYDALSFNKVQRERKNKLSVLSTCRHTRIYIHTYTQTRTHTHTHAHTRTHTHTHAHAHQHTHTQTHTYKHASTHVN